MSPQELYDARTFVKRLLAKTGDGLQLGDPRSPGAIAAWAGICDGFPDADLKTMVPTAIRLMFRKDEMAARLTASGLRAGVTLQHEAIAPYVITFRRMRAIKRGEIGSTEQLMAETRRELRELNNRFQQALEEAIALRDENQHLRVNLETAKVDGERYRKEAQTARNALDDATARALNKLSLALGNLKEVLELRTNDPDSNLTENAALSVQSYYMVLEDLGHGKEAMKLAQRILGDKFNAMGLV